MPSCKQDHWLSVVLTIVLLCHNRGLQVSVKPLHQPVILWLIGCSAKAGRSEKISIESGTMPIQIELHDLLKYWMECQIW